MQQQKKLDSLDDDTEIVIVSDTVRQRRARTPSTNGSGGGVGGTSESSISTTTALTTTASTSTNTTTTSIMPDLLPTTFHLAESSSIFSSISDNKSDSELLSDERSTKQPETSSKSTTHEFSVVEIREKNLEQVQNVDIRESGNVHTIQLESVHQFEPEHVETVHIFDASEDTASDTDTCGSTSKLDEDGDDNNNNNDEDDNVDLRLNDEPFIRVEKQRISFDEKRKPLETERDFLRDSEISETSVATRSRPASILPTLRDILLSDDRNSFYNPEKENYDEPLIFSEDEDIPRFSLELPMDYDSDSDTVFI